MKKKLLSIALGAAMVASMLAGCGSNASTTAPAASTPAPVETKSEAPAEPASSEAAADTAQASTEITGKIYLVSKGFQHQFWQAVLQGANEAAAEYGVEIDFQGPDTESDIAQQVQMLNNAFNNNPPAIGLAALDTEACRILLAGHDHQQIAGIGAKTHIRICILADDKFIVLNRGIPFEVNVTHMNAQPATFEKLQLPIGQRLTKLPAQDLLQNLALQRKGRQFNWYTHQRRTKLY